MKISGKSPLFRQSSDNYRGLQRTKSHPVGERIEHGQDFFSQSSDLRNKRTSSLPAGALNQPEKRLDEEDWPRTQIHRGRKGAPGDPRPEPFPKKGTPERNKLDATIKFLESNQGQLFNHDKARITPAKMYGYLLNSTKVENSGSGSIKPGQNEGKSFLLFILGYTIRPKKTDELKDPDLRKSGKLLTKQIREGLADPKNMARLKPENNYGVKFRVDMNLESPTGKKFKMTTVWMFLHRGDGILDLRPNLTTAYAYNKKQSDADPKEKDSKEKTT